MILTTEGKQELTKDNILAQVNELNLWKYYTDTEVKHGRHIKGDTSAVFFVKSDNTILLKDFAKKTYNIWTYLMFKYNKNFYQVLRQIANDFKLNFVYKKGRPSMTIYGSDIEKQKKIIESTSTSIRIAKKPMSNVGIAYWLQYGITAEQLKEDSMYELDHYWLIKDDSANKFTWREDNPIFCKDFSKQLGLPHKYKIYKPLAPKSEKHFQNVGVNAVYGIDDLISAPDNKELLIITKSYKDWRVLKNLGYTAVGFQGENSIPDADIMTGFKNWFNKVIVFFDNDEAGINGARKIKYIYGIDHTMIPLEYKVKDPSDFYKEYKESKTKELCSNLIKEIR